MMTAAYQRAWPLRARGMSLVEMLIVIGILGILAAVVTPRLISFYSAYQLDALTQDLVQTIRFAEMHSMQSEGSSAYSVHLVSGSGGTFTLYRGTNFAARDTNYDEVHTLPGSLALNFSGTGPDITFSKLEGTTTNAGAVTISWPDGNQARTVTITSYGVLDRQ